MTAAPKSRIVDVHSRPRRSALVSFMRLPRLGVSGATSALVEPVAGSKRYAGLDGNQQTAARGNDDDADQLWHRPLRRPLRRGIPAVQRRRPEVDPVQRLFACTPDR